MALASAGSSATRTAKPAALTNLGITLEQPGRAGRMKSVWRVTHEEGPEVYRKRSLS